MRPEVKKFKEDMEKQFGKNAIRPAIELTSMLDSRIPTGSVSLDIAIGGGIPFGRFIQLSGGFSTYKSTTGYHIISNVQKMTQEIPIFDKDGNVKGEREVPLQAFITLGENNSYTNEYAELLGIDTEELLVNECGGMEEALEIAHTAQKKGIANLIMIDSLEALEPMKEYESAMGESVQMGIKPKLFGEYLRKFQSSNNKLSREGKLPCTLIGINQLREKIGQYGDPEYTPGGRAIGFYASIDIRFRKGDTITIGKGVNKEAIGQTIKFKIFKSKVSVPLRTGSFDIYFGEGGPVPRGYVDNFKEVIIEGIAYGVIDKQGSWISYGKAKAQGADAFVELLREKEELYEEIKEELMTVALSSTRDIFEEVDEEEEDE